MANRQNGKMPRHFPLSVLVAVLFAALAVTSGMVGFILGRNASYPTGELVDTIVLSPGDASRLETAHSLSGRLRLSTGDPLSEATVELTDTGAKDITDRQGKFFFSGVRAGAHRLEVKNSAGELMAGMDLVLEFSGGVSAEFGKDYTSFHMPEDARMLEFTITVDENSGMVEEGSAYFVTKDGRIVDFSGASLKIEEPAVAILPNVDVVSPGGQILVPSRGVVVTPGGDDVKIPVGEEVLPGVTVEEDGSVHIDGNGGTGGTDESSDIAGNSEIDGNGEIVGNDEIVLTPDGDIILPDGSDKKVGDDVIVAEDGKIEEMPELPDPYVPEEPDPEPTDPDPESSAPEQSDPEESDPEGSGLEPDPSDDPVIDDPVDDPDADDPVVGEPPADGGPAVDEPPADEPTVGEPAAPDGEAPGQEESSSQPDNSAPNGGLAVIDSETGISWKQLSVIDLFKNRTAGIMKNGDGGQTMIAPGSSGYYEFRLENPEAFDIAYTMTFEEHSFHLPIRYSLLDGRTGYSYLYREKIGLPDQPLMTKEFVIPAGGEQRFRIEWDWDFEDWYDMDTDDAIDTAAARGANPTYMLGILLRAEQIVGEPEDPEVSYADGDTRYPGKH